MRAAYQDLTSQPDLSADELTQIVVVAEADLAHLGGIVVLVGARLVDRHAWANSSVVGRQETGIAACSQEGLTAQAGTPLAAGGAASVEDHRTAVEGELVLQARQRQTRRLRHLGHASYPSNLVAKRLRFLGDVRKVGVFALVMIAHLH